MSYSVYIKVLFLAMGMLLYQIEVCLAQTLTPSGTDTSEETVSTTSSTGPISQTPQSVESDKEKLSLLDWGEGGIFQKFKPEDEIISKRDRTSKHFKNPDGSISAYFSIGTSVNFKENGQWKTIHREIEKNNTNKNPKYAYANISNVFKSYYPEKNVRLEIVLYEREK